MRILSLSWDYNSSIAYFENGQLRYAVSEERFTRKKNECSFPLRAIESLQSEWGVDTSKLDAVAIPSLTSSTRFIILQLNRWTVQDYLREQHQYWYPRFYENKTYSNPEASFIEVFKDKIYTDQYPSEYWDAVVKKGDFESFTEDLPKIVSQKLGVPLSKVHRLEHHRSHASYAYHFSPFRGKPVLAFTMDSWGDDKNATIGMYDAEGNYKLLYATKECVVARVYRYTTLLLGMKPNEHEYKVMGLAPYGKKEHAEKALKVLESRLHVEGIEFKSGVVPADTYFWLKEKLEGCRFDSIAWALQTWVENLMTQWVANAVKKFGVGNVVFGGGVAMNIKAMGKVAALPEVSNLFVPGSPSDDTISIGAGFYLNEELQKKEKGRPEKEPVSTLFLGPASTQEKEAAAVKNLDTGKYRVTQSVTARTVAELLSQGLVLARCAGRMEFGQRSLGNRSILADASVADVKEKINQIIKNRDFWMPFAPVILDRLAPRYIVNPKNLQCSHMTIGFETTPEGAKAIPAAVHPADKTVRVQILTKEANPDLYSILEEFEKLTGRGGLLNTSFNLHGHPIVNTPEEAIDVLERSGLDGLVLNHYLILKNLS